jgi:pyridoxine kinase
LAALLLAWMHHHPGDLRLAVEKAVAGLQAVLHSTARAAQHTQGADERPAQVGSARRDVVIGTRYDMVLRG